MQRIKWVILSASLVLMLAAMLCLSPVVVVHSAPALQSYTINAAPPLAYWQTLTLSPETLPVGQVNVPYSAQIIASGGTPPYTYSLSGQFPTELTFNQSNGTISGTVTGVGSATFTITVIDSIGNQGSRQYTITFTDTGEPLATAPPEEPVATIISPQDFEATRIANLRLALGPPRVEISDEIDALAIRTGPFVGASLRNLAFPQQEYNVIGEYRPPGSRYTWYLIEYEIDFGVDSPNEPIIVNGWVSGRFATLRGFILDVPAVANPFDGISTAVTGISGRSALKSNIYRYPAGSSPLVARFDEGSTFEVLGRTVFDRRNWTYWIYIRLDRTGQTGWTRYTPFFEINGNINIVPVY